jgi:hypothetical protein
MITYKDVYKSIKKFKEIDIKIRTRKRRYVYCRFVYYKLCKDLVYKYSQRNCCNYIDIDRATLIHGLKQFDANYGRPWFEENGLYEMCKDYLEGKELTEEEIIMNFKWKLESKSKEELIEYIIKNHKL